MAPSGGAGASASPLAAWSDLGVLVGVGGGFNRCGNMNDGLMDSWMND